MIDQAGLVQEVMDGDFSPYQALYILKELQKTLKTQIEIVEVEAFNQSKYEERTFKSGDLQIEKRNGKKNWNYKGCKSFLEVNDKLDKVKEDLKANFVQWEKGKSIVDENGEIGEVPEVTYSKGSIIVKKIPLN